MTYFRDKYLSGIEGATVLDVGARNLKNRKRSYTYRPLFDRFKYYGMDTSPGNNVDIVGYENIRGTFDVLISGQTMEHVKQPWEWVKSLVPYFNHYICIIAPHTWKEHKNPKHQCPFDTYRYFPDGMQDLFDYAGIKVVEIETSRTDTMCVGIKDGVPLAKTDVQFMPRPITEKELRQLNMKGHSLHWTICEVIRAIHAEATEIKSDRIAELTRTCLVMAKRMNKKLIEYNQEIGKELWALKGREERREDRCET